MDLSNFYELLHGFVKIDAWISLSCNRDLSNLFYVFLALCQTKPSLPWVRCAFGNVLIYQMSLTTSKFTSTIEVYLF